MQYHRAVLRVSVIVTACALPRLTYLWVAGPPETGVYYWELSDGILRARDLIYQGVPTTAFEPLYPLFLALARWLTADNAGLVVMWQIAVACLGATLLDRLTRAMSGGRMAGMVAALCYGFYPYLIRQSVAWMEITLLSTLLIGAWHAWIGLHQRAADGAASRRLMRAAAVCGVWLGLMVLTRAMTLPIAVFAVGWLLVSGMRREGATAGVVLALLLLPSTARSVRMDGSLLPTRTGENLFVGNNEYADALLPRYDLDLLPDYGSTLARKRLQLPPEREPTARDMDRALTDEALSFMAARPMRTAKAKLANLFYFFQPRLLPFEPSDSDTTITLLPDGQAIVDRARQRSLADNLSHSLAYGLVAVAALVGWASRRRQWRDDVLVLVSVGVFTLVSIIYFPTTRMRAPIDPVLMAYAGCAVGAWLTRRRLHSDSLAGHANSPHPGQQDRGRRRQEAQ